MALIAMCCYDTVENGRTEYTKRTLESLNDTVDWGKHRLVLIDNASCIFTRKLLTSARRAMQNTTVITLSENVGTARAINMAMRMRQPSEAVIKCDNDVVWNKAGWVDEMEEAIGREPKLGILGLKRRDLRQTPYDPDPNFRSELVQLPHIAGEKWYTVEVTQDIMGTCTMFNPSLMDAIGGMAQPALYGFDDCLYSLRSRLAGFYNAFLCGVDIEHIDRGDSPYVEVKQKQAGEVWQEYQKWHTEYCNGTRDIYYDGK